MAPMAISNQRLATTVGGGLPLCLSGILDLTQMQGSSRDPPVNLRRSSKETKNSSATEDYTDSRIGAAEEHGPDAECSGRNDTLPERPRHDFSSQIAEHERRRESIRKQRSIRGIIRNSVEEQRAFAQRNAGTVHNIIHELMQDLLFRDEIVAKELQHHTCAKAA